MQEKLEELIKGLKSLKDSILPSIKANTAAPKPPKAIAKLPGIAPSNQKNPIKQIEQIKNTDIKDMKLREAHEALKVNKSTGQWSEDDINKAEAAKEYHIFAGKIHPSTRVEGPISLNEINAKYGNSQKLHASGHIVVHKDSDLMPKMAKEEKLVGGLADGEPDLKFDEEQIDMGVKVEREHTKDKKAQKEITKDHLKEDPKYYDHLKEMEDKYQK